MKKTKVENISGIKLDFFLRQNKEDVRVVLNPGEFSWCDDGTTTKSMILYERKKLIKSSGENGGDEKMVWEKEEISIKPLSEPTGQLFYIDFKYEDTLANTPDIVEALNKSINEEIEILTPLEKAKKETEEYKKESEKTYKGKKRGRKKKRGPKPGSKRKKGSSPSSESPAQ